MKRKFGNGKKYTGPVKHQAIYNGRRYNLSTTDWSRMIDCPISQVDRGLKQYGSVQAYIDECHEKSQHRDRLFKNFIFRGACHG